MRIRSGLAGFSADNLPRPRAVTVAAESLINCRRVVLFMVGVYQRRFILLFKMNEITRREAARLIGGTTVGLLLPIGASRGQTASASSPVLMRAIPSPHQNY